MAIFGSLAAKLQETFAKLRNKGKLTEDDKIVFVTDQIVLERIQKYLAELPEE